VTNTIFHDKSMLFLVLIVAFFVGASITDVFFDYDAEAKKTQFTTPKVGDEIGIKAKGTGICTSGGDSGTAKANVRFLLLVQEADGDISNGVAKTKMKLNATCEGAPRELVTDGSLAFTLDNDNGILTMSGDLKARDGTTHSLEAIGVISEGKNGKAKIDLRINLVAENGDVITMPMKGSAVINDLLEKHT